MINCSDFSKILDDNQINFFTGVPDSLLKEICGFLSDRHVENHIIAANEGNAVAIAAGYHLATGKVPLVYLQNSGMGNTINPITSLMSQDVYQIPMLLMIGWRGEPGVKDEPQHVNQGKITEDMLKVLNIPYLNLTSESQEVNTLIKNLVDTAKTKSCPVALLISKDTFEPYKYQSGSSESTMSREEAVTILAKKVSSPECLIATTTGKLSRELYEFRKSENSKVVDFYNVGSMGHLSQIALGLAKYLPERKVYCFDGDGAAIMHMGGLAIAAAEKLKNYYYIMFNNGAHDSVGGQPTIAQRIDFEKVAKGLGFKEYFRATNKDELDQMAGNLLNSEGPVFFEILVKKGARKDLGRPKETPVENKNAFMAFIKESR